MAGLAALLSIGSDRITNDMLGALSKALHPRGSEESRQQLGSARLLVRAALPMLYEHGGSAFAVDGTAEVGSIAARYAERGAAGLVGGVTPYAMIVARPDSLLLARNGAGPALYYARNRSGLLVASEPAALLAAGVSAELDPAVVARFLETGETDSGPQTFFSAVHRVLPGQVVEVARSGSDGWQLRTQQVVPPAAGSVSARLALLGAVGEDRVGVLLGRGLPAAALLGVALSARGERGGRALPVYSSNFPGLPGDSSAYASALLAPLPDGAIRHRALPFFPDEIDMDGFLTDLGEPVPDLASYLCWAVARATSGEVDVLLSAAGQDGPAGHLPRLADRIAARYGIAVRLPYRLVESTGAPLRAELAGLAERLLPATAARTAGQAQPSSCLEPPLREVLLRLRSELVKALLYPRHGSADHVALGQLRALVAGMTRSDSTDADRLWRRYVLERWLVTIAAAQAAGQPVLPGARGGTGRPATARPSAVRPRAAEVTVDGTAWHRQLIGTEPLVNGDKITEKIAWYVAEAAAGIDKSLRPALRRPWYLLVAAKPVAVAQGLSRAIWEIKPTLLARAVVRIGRRSTRLTDPWTAQVALDSGGPLRTVCAALCASLGWRAWSERMAGPVLSSVAAPRRDACPPAHLAVVPPPARPDQVAEQIRQALRTALPAEVFQAFAGCAIVGVDDDGPRLLGWSERGGAPGVLLTVLCQDNPFGQADARTPLLLGLQVNRPVAQSTSRKGARPGAKRR
jgi:hypothetical protein